MTALLLGSAAALLVGLSKTGVPGVSLPAILLMAEAFPGAEKLSVAAIMPILISHGMQKEQFRGTWAWFFLIVNLSKVPLLLSLELFSVNMVTPDMLWFDLCVLPLVVVGALVGRRVFRIIPQKVFDPLVLLLAGVAALRMVMT